MGQALTNENFNAEVDAALEQAKNAQEQPRILDVIYHPEASLTYL